MTPAHTYVPFSGEIIGPPGNLVGTIPGRSEETIILLSHTDGANAVWENGPAGILALARYFASIPRR